MSEPSPSVPSARRRGTLVGALAALLGLAAAEVFGLVLPGDPSVVAAIADRVISTMPAAPRELLIGLVGTLDKPLLVLGVVAVIVAVGAVVGRACSARPSRAPVWFAAGAALAFVVAWNGSTADLVPMLLMVAVAAVVAILVWTRYAPAAPGVVVSDTAGSASPGAATVDRRHVLATAGVLTAAGVLGLGIAAVARRGTVAAIDTVRAALRLPAPTQPAPPVPAGVTPAVPGLDPAVTPNADFYRIDVAITPPAIDVATWSLAITGRVDKPLTLTYADLLSLASIERHVTLTCVSNPVGGSLVGTARWQGVRLTDLLEKVGVHDDASLVSGRSADGFFSAGFPRALLADGRDAMVAYAMNGVPLPVEHGFPARLVVPGLYGYVSATKWLSEIRLTTIEDDVPYWVARSWTADGRIEASSRVDVPRDGATVAPGRVMVGGRAWHQHTAVGSVQVSVDGAGWQDAELAPALGVDTWRLWSWAWDASSGEHQLRVRVVDADGTPQTAAERPVFPGASSGLHTIGVVVR